MPYTLKEVAEFCYARQKCYYKDGSLMKRSFEEWGGLVVDAAHKNKLHVVSGADKELIGVCLATPKYAAKVVYVHEIICIKGAFRIFIQFAFAKYPGWTIAGLRDKQLKQYKENNLWAADQLT